MRYEDMVSAVQQYAAVSAQQAEIALRATLQALAETTHRETDDLQRQLPGELHDVAPAGHNPDRSLDEFLVRVGDVEGLPDPGQATEHVQAALRVLAQATSTGQLRDLMEDLPAEIRELLPDQTGLSSGDETLLDEVRVQAGVAGLEQARELTEAVLGVLARHISAGQAQDLASQLPGGLGAALFASERAGRTESDAFFAEINAACSVTDSDQVRAHTERVFTVLQQWAPAEFADATSQLPKPLATLTQ